MYIVYEIKVLHKTYPYDLPEFIEPDF